jgi:hypothetical protein
MAINPKSFERPTAIIDAVKRAARQEQFLEVVSADEARRRFDACIDRSPLGSESVRLGSTVPMSTALPCARPTLRAPATACRSG